MNVGRLKPVLFLWKPHPSITPYPCAKGTQGEGHNHMTKHPIPSRCRARGEGIPFFVDLFCVSFVVFFVLLYSFCSGMVPSFLAFVLFYIFGGLVAVVLFCFCFCNVCPFGGIFPYFNLFFLPRFGAQTLVYIFFFWGWLLVAVSIDFLYCPYCCYAVYECSRICFLLWFMSLLLCWSCMPCRFSQLVYCFFVDGTLQCSGSHRYFFNFQRLLFWLYTLPIHPIFSSRVHLPFYLFLYIYFFMHFMILGLFPSDVRPSSCWNKDRKGQRF